MSQPINGNMLQFGQKHVSSAKHQEAGTMHRRDLERAFGERSYRIAEGLTQLGFPVSRQAVQKWKGKIPNRSAKIIRAIAGNKIPSA